MAKEDTKFDVAVIGAGPAGIMAAVTAANHGLRVALIEKNSTPAKKLLLTGNGRCNLTNSEFNLKELVKNYNNGEFLFHAFSVFGPKEAIKFFNDLGIKTKTEANGRVFPVSESAKEILDALQEFLAKNKVDTIFSSEILDIAHKGKKIIGLALKDKTIVAKNYILCTGGKAFPSTGSTGFGYELAKKLGHTIINPLPALSPIKLKEEWVKNLQGISLKDIKITLLSRHSGIPPLAGQNNKKEFSEEGEIVFTHFGISGPSVLNISSKVIGLLEKGEVKIQIDLFPLLNHEELAKGLEAVFKKYPRQITKNILTSFVPERLAEVLLDISKINSGKIANSMSKLEKTQIVKILKSFEVTPEMSLDFNQGMVTKGGISLKEIDHKTMKSKIIDNLYFAGEIIDVDGKTGGFNLQTCWTTGFVAGQNC